MKLIKKAAQTMTKWIKVVPFLANIAAITFIADFSDIIRKGPDPT